MSFLDFLPKPVLLALIAILAFFAAKYEVELQSTTIELAQARATYATEVAKAAAETLTAQTAARETEHTLLAQAADTQKATDEATTALTAQRDALRLRLKSAGSPALTFSCPAAATASLKTPASGGDKSVVPDPTDRLVNEAYRGDEIRLNLLECYVLYDAARDALAK